MPAEDCYESESCPKPKRSRDDEDEFLYEEYDEDTEDE
jgi:hypothetical protein